MSKQFIQYDILNTPAQFFNQTDGVDGSTSGGTSTEDREFSNTTFSIKKLGLILLVGLLVGAGARLILKTGIVLTLLLTIIALLASTTYFYRPDNATPSS